MTSNEEIYLSYLCDRIMVVCDRMNKKLDVMDEQQRLFTYTDSYAPLQYPTPPYVMPWQTPAETYFNNQPQPYQPLQPPNNHQPTQPPDPPDWHCHSPTNNQPTYTAPPYDHPSLVDAGFHPPLTQPPDQLGWQQLYYHQISAPSVVDQPFYTACDAAAPPLQEPDQRMEVFFEIESHLAVTDRRVDNLHPPDFPGPEPPTAHSDWQQPASGLLSGFNLPPQGQPIYPPVVAPPQPPAPMIPPCSPEDQRVSSSEVISPPSRQRSPTAPLPAADAPPNADDTRHPSLLHLPCSRESHESDGGREILSEEIL